MGCCVCAGTCNHVGPHSYCAAHGGSMYWPPIVPSPNTQPLLQPSWWFPPSPCDHCWCLKAEQTIGHDGVIYPDHDGEGPHVRCCKCKTIMAERFALVPGQQEGGSEGDG